MNYSTLLDYFHLFSVHLILFLFPPVLLFSNSTFSISSSTRINNHKQSFLMRTLYTNRTWFSETRNIKVAQAQVKILLDQRGDRRCGLGLRAMTRGGFLAIEKAPIDAGSTSTALEILNALRGPRDVLGSLKVLPVSNPGCCPSSLHVATTNKGKKLLVTEVISTAGPICSFHPDSPHRDETLIWQIKASRNLHFLTMFVWTFGIWKETHASFRTNPTNFWIQDKQTSHL